jgi:hypothetical protein
MSDEIEYLVNQAYNSLHYAYSLLEDNSDNKEYVNEALKALEEVYFDERYE